MAAQAEIPMKGGLDMVSSPNDLLPNPPFTPELLIQDPTIPLPPFVLPLPPSTDTQKAKEGGATASARSSNCFSNSVPAHTPGGVLLITHPDCILHMVKDHPECPDRLIRILKGLKRNFSKLEIAQAPLATKELLLLFHTPEHVTKMMAIFQEVTALKARRIRNPIHQIDGDTAVMIHTEKSCLRAAGSGCLGVDKVMSGAYGSVFCAVRPPGHHAERDKAMGFCFFSSAGIAAKYAQAKYGTRRVAIIDFDAHHGNGTVRGVEDDPNLFYGSTHQGNFYPGTGLPEETGVANNIVNIPLEKGSGSDAFRKAYHEIMLPRLSAFGPELLIISAGFDAHVADPLANINLESEDFHWVTKELVKVAKSCPHPCPVVSMLEGGYNLTAITESAVEHVRALVEEYGALPKPTALINASPAQALVAKLMERKEKAVAGPAAPLLEPAQAQAGEGEGEGGGEAKEGSERPAVGEAAAASASAFSSAVGGNAAGAEEEKDEDDGPAPAALELVASMKSMSISKESSSRASLAHNLSVDMDEPADSETDG